MKKVITILAAVLTGALVFSSCEKDPKEEKPTGPLSSIAVTCQDETVNGVVNDDSRSISFTFRNAEDFSHANITAELNKGWTMTFPKTLTDVDLQSTPIFNFTSPDNAIVKYSVKFSSNSFPVVDQTKIQIEGLESGECITVDNGTKTIIVKYNQEKIDFAKVKLIFNPGSVQEGVKLPEKLEFNFHEGIEQPIVFELDGQRPYTLKLDVSSYLGKSESEIGFSDVSASFVDTEKCPFIQVYTSDHLTGIPVLGLANFWLPSNPRDWEGKYNEDLAEGQHFEYKHDDFSFPGDWKEDRPVMNTFGTLAIVYIDQAKVKGGITPNRDYAKTLSDIQNLVVVTGCKSDPAGNIDYMLYDNGSMVFNPSGDKAIAFRNSAGFDANGVLSFQVAATKGDKLYKVPFQNDWVTGRIETITSSATEEWNVTDASWVYGWALRDGKALKTKEIIMNDASDYISDGGVLGLGWQGFYGKRVVIGRTYDNKIAIMVSGGGEDMWDGSIDNAITIPNWLSDIAGWGHCKGYTTSQMIWIAKQLGWRDAALLATTDDEKSSNFTNVKVNGKTVISKDQATYHPDEYDNNGSGIKTSYYITFDEK